MSSNLNWYPVIKHKKKCLSDEFKWILQKRFGNPINRVFDASDLQYLEGLQDAGQKEATLLIEAIKKHEEIILEEVF